MIGNDWDNKLSVIWNSDGFKKFMSIIDNEYNTAKMIYDSNKVDEYLELLKTNENDVSNWKSADNKEIKSNIQFNDFLIFIDSYINVNFLLLKKS